MLSSKLFLATDSWASNPCEAQPMDLCCDVLSKALIAGYMAATQSAATTETRFIFDAIKTDATTTGRSQFLRCIHGMH
jgi:hypothetical protein